MGYTERAADVWGGVLSRERLSAIAEHAHLRSVIVYPLATENRNVLGGLVIGLNRTYESLGEFEQESLRNIVNVIAIALGKALLYEALQVTKTTVPFAASRAG